MDNPKQPKWYFKTWTLVFSFLAAGPFMLPLVWKNPRFSLKLKIIISVIVLALTWFLFKFMEKSLESITSGYLSSL